MPLPIYRRTDLEERPHVSFSEVYSYYNCPYNHWLSYREKVTKEDTIYTIYGKAVGGALEKYKKFGSKNAWISMGKQIFRFVLDNEWPEKIKEDQKDWRKWVKSALRSFNDTLVFLDQNYPNWELIDFEYPLYENIEGSSKKFKGFIDLIFKWNDEIYIFDFKTTNVGWIFGELEDAKKLYQVALYKHFYCEKNKIDPKTVNTGYLLLKRNPPKKSNTSVELIAQTSGAKKLNNAVDWLVEQSKGIEKGIKLKNITSCKFCICGAK